MTKLKPISEIDAELYEKLADKTLSNKCVIRTKTGETTTEYQEDWGFKLNNIGNLFNDYNGEEWEIIGHEPQLPDVLLALSKQKEINEINTHVSLGFLGISILLDGKMDYIRFSCDLTKSFDSQPEETKRKLHELLCKK